MTDDNTTTPVDDSGSRWTYGLIAVGLGLATLLISFYVATQRYKTGQEASGVLAAITGTVGAIVGAYFGVQVGSAGKDKAEARATVAHNELSNEKDKSQALIDELPAGQARSILQSFR